MILLVLFIAGLIFGSFDSALIWRLYQKDHLPQKAAKSKKRLKELSIVSGRSMCPHCHHMLTTADLVPVVSWIMLRGKCRYCAQPISWQYPVVELVTALLFVTSYFWWPQPFAGVGLLSYLIWLCCLVLFMALAVYDLRWYILPDRIVYPLIGLVCLGLLGHVIYTRNIAVLLLAIAGVVAIAGVFYILYVVSKGAWIGFGDVKLAVALGLLVDSPSKALLIVFSASLLGTLAAIPLFVLRKAQLSSRIPFGPLLLTATIIVVYWGDTILHVYSQSITPR